MPGRLEKEQNRNPQRVDIISLLCEPDIFKCRIFLRQSYYWCEIIENRGTKQWEKLPATYHS
jgi:hypothetical protein